VTEHPRVAMTGVTKTFGPVQALDDVDLEVDEREVHGLLGGNGAGKTTLMNVLYGLYRADRGEIRIDGRETTISSPRAAIAAGVGMVHQTFLQVDTFSVTENVVLGTELPGRTRMDLGPARTRIGELSERFGLALDPGAVVEDLPVGVRQRVEILKALYRGSKVLILDEPTTNLTPQEVDDLFASMRTMVEEGMSVILITHKIRETLAVCDRMTVMRNGRRVATTDRGDTDAERLAATMVGGAPVADDADEAEESAAVVATGFVAAEDVAGADEERGAFETAIEVTGLVAANDHGVEIVRGFDLAIGGGEVVGIAGVAGNGQVELAEALAGVRRLSGGSVRIAGTEMAGRSTAGWLDGGVAYVPEDRHRDGILPSSSIAENLLLGSQRHRSARRAGMIDWRSAKAGAVQAIDAFSIQASGPLVAAGDLSGGNIQRVILARAFARTPRLLILHNPTRGLDLESTRFVYENIQEATSRGCAVLLISEDLDEVIALGDRVLALYAGSIAGEWPRGSADPYEVGRRMTGLAAR
jgi:general nucleoside transport system ATP-binding protein